MIFFLNSLAFKFDRKHYLSVHFYQSCFNSVLIPNCEYGSPGFISNNYKNNDTIISKMEVLGINKKKSKHSTLDFFFKCFKRDYIPNILAVLTSQFLGSEAPPPPPPPQPRTAIDFLPGRLQASDIGKLTWIRLKFTPYHLLMSTNVWSENYEIWRKIKRENFAWR